MRMISYHRPFFGTTTITTILRWSFPFFFFFFFLTSSLGQPLVPTTTDPDMPFALGFYFRNDTLPSDTCLEELEMIRTTLYPVYQQDIIHTTNLNATGLILLHNYTARNCPDRKKTRRQRQLLRRLSSSSSSIQQQQQQQEVKQQHPQHPQHRQLQRWCYPLCKRRPRMFLIAHGCREECRITRRRRTRRHRNRQLREDDEPNEDMEEENMTEEQEEEKSNSQKNHHVVVKHDSSSSSSTSRWLQQQDDTVSAIMTDPFYTIMGNETEILAGQGDDSATTFYTKVRELIPTANPCYTILLNMIYQRIPLVISLPYDLVPDHGPA
jgi:hypothetical protein